MKTLKRIGFPLALILFLSFGFFFLLQSSVSAADECNGDTKCKNLNPKKPVCKNPEANNSTCVQCTQANT
ncbi:MAG: hypothetical protein AAB801_02265, partial [Patescibacteria group bacterium]